MKARAWLGVALSGAGLAAVVTIAHGAVRRDLRAADPDPCDRVEEINRDRGTSPLGLGSGRIHVMGDSYAQGWDLVDPEMSWPFGLSTRLGSAVIVDGVAGSGFTTSSICPDQSFADRAGDAPAPERDLVVVQGGLNDVDVDAGRRELMTAVTTVVRGSRADVVVGPPPAPTRSSHDLRRVDRILARGAPQWSDLCLRHGVERSRVRR